MSVDLYPPTKAVATWLEHDAKRFLTKGDPKSKSITLSAAFGAEAAFFELAVPIKLNGLDTGTEAILRIYASTIASLELSKNPTIELGIQGKFDSNALSLDFTLKDPPAFIVPIGALEPLSAARDKSRYVLDTIRDLSKATALSIYIEACNAPNELQEICDVVTQGLVTPCDIQHHMTSMYGGKGGKRIYPSVPALPPSYAEAAKSPPPPPPIDGRGKKRAREVSDTECDDDITRLRAELRTLKQMLGRVETLEAESKELRQKNTNLEEKYKKAEQGNTQLQEKCDALESRLEDNESTNEALKKRLEEIESTNEELEDRLKSTNEEWESRFQEGQSSEDAFKEEYGIQLTELRDDMTELGNIVQCVQDGQITDESLEVIQKVVIKEMLRRLADR